MFVESFIDLYRAGILKREVDGALLHAAFFVGSKAFYQALRAMPESERAKFQMAGVSFVNELYGDEASKRSARIKGRFINNAMMATLLGAVFPMDLQMEKSLAASAANTISWRKVLHSTMRARLYWCVPPATPKDK